MKISRTTWGILAAWVVLVGGYAAASLLLPPGHTLTTFGDLALCVVPLITNACLLWNVASPTWRKNSFWMLLALGCTLWLVGQLLWTYFELVMRVAVPNPFAGDVVIFLHVVPMIGALALQPHVLGSSPNRHLRYLDFALLMLWWFFLYAFIVIPWQYIRENAGLYGASYNGLYTVENVVYLVGLGVLCLQTSGRWRIVYAHLFGSALLYNVGSLSINVAIDQGTYYTGSLYDIPLVASFVWLGTAGIVAYRIRPATETVSHSRLGEGIWPTVLAMAGVLSMPAFAVWNWRSTAPQDVRDFRLGVTVGAILLGTSLVFLRQYLVDREHLRLLLASEESLDNLKRLQTQLVQSEKLASLGQLAAGAAHEINNPLTAILGYSDVLMEDAAIGEKARGIAEKIRVQARRTRTLINNLLSFARQVPAEKQLLDLNAIIASAMQLRTLDLRDKNIRIDLQNRSVIPGVRGDPNQLLQVFYQLITNAVDAMEEVGGGVLTVRTAREKGNVIVEFSDTGPGIREPHRVFDPFYTTKPVGKGTGLGLSICYGIVQEHGGRIFGFNRSEGGTTFRIEFPAVLALLPQTPAATPAPVKTSST